MLLDINELSKEGTVALDWYFPSRDGKLFVVESHTHFPKPDYLGPKSDRIKIFHDDNHDGRPDRITIFAVAVAAGLHWLFLKVVFLMMQPATARRIPARTQLARGTKQLARAFASQR